MRTARIPHILAAAALIGALAAVAPARAQQEAAASGDDSAELAKKLQNPVAALTSVPIKLDWDTGIGPAGADRYLYVVQPVIPISLNSEWNIISRTIAPFIDARSPVEGGSDTSGLGDILRTQPVSFALGYRKYVDRPEGGPDWGFRFTVTFLFPK